MCSMLPSLCCTFKYCFWSAEYLVNRLKDFLSTNGLCGPSTTEDTPCLFTIKAYKHRFTVQQVN